eukprot:s1184_g2.t3
MAAFVATNGEWKHGVPEVVISPGKSQVRPGQTTSFAKPLLATTLGVVAARAVATRRTKVKCNAMSRRDLLAAAPAAVAPVMPAPAQAAQALQVPNFGVGAWAWGDRLFWGYNEKQDQELREGFDACIKGGVKLFDTAEIYGPGRSEELLGTFLRESGAKDVQVATKFAAFPWKLDRQDVVKACKGSLERLGHSNALDYSNALEGSSAVRAISKTLGERGIPLTSNQIQYSLLYRYPELNGMKETCDELGVKILAYSPLALGALTGKWTPSTPPSGPRAAISDKLQNLSNKTQKDAAWPGLLDAMKDVAQQHGPETTLSQVAIAWCIAKGTTPIPGVRNVRQAQDNIRATQLKLSANEVQALDSAAAKVSGFLSPEASPFNSLSRSMDTKQAMLHLAAFHGQATAMSVLAWAASRSSNGALIFGIKDAEGLTPLAKALKVWKIPSARILALSGAPAANATLIVECRPDLVAAVLQTELQALSRAVAEAPAPAAGNCLVPPNSGRNSTLLHLAAELSSEEGGPQIIRELLDAGAKVDRTDSNGDTALNSALRLHLAGYNRANYFENLHLKQSRNFRKQQIVHSQADLFRADVEQAIGASSAVQDRLIVVSALLLGVTAHTNGWNLAAQTRSFLEDIFYLCIGNAFLYFLVSLIASISANILARKCQKDWRELNGTKDPNGRT